MTVRVPRHLRLSFDQRGWCFPRHVSPCCCTSHSLSPLYFSMSLHAMLVRKKLKKPSLARLSPLAKGRVSYGDEVRTKAFWVRHPGHIQVTSRSHPGHIQVTSRSHPGHIKNNTFARPVQKALVFIIKNKSLTRPAYIFIVFNMTWL